MSKGFSKLYDVLMLPLERVRFKKIRSDLLKEASGKVLELGSGTGVNFPLYHGVEVTAIEPSQYMINRSVSKKEQSKVPIEIIQASAEQLPFNDNSYDTVVATLVYCTIPNVDKALQEMKRVCKPNGKILMFEHVKMDHPLLAKLQETMTPFWMKICDGCCLDRDTYKLVKSSGIRVVEIKDYYNSLFITLILRNEK